jgi:hypothetical protein
MLRTILSNSGKRLVVDFMTNKYSREASILPFQR